MTGGAEQRRRFGRYETLFRIAGGGMAEVYAARILGEAGFQKVVALKRMLPTLAEDERFVEMFLDEGRVAANITSPNVVQTMDLGRAEDDSLYLVMELVVGVSHSRLLRNVLSSGTHLEPSIAIEILAQAASGLHDAHEATTPMGEALQIVHRDISPQNILIDRSGRTRITDFGVARALLRSSHTQTGEVKGKMAYFAPEQARAGVIDRRVDIFALGIVAWETFAGRRLFKSDNPLQTLAKITQEPIPVLADLRPDLPPGISAAIDKALQRDPDTRFQTGRDFAAALRAALAPATTAQVGAYVREHGGDELNRLEDGLKTALGGGTPSQPNLPVAEDRTPPSSSQVIPSIAAHVGTEPTMTGSTTNRALWVTLMVLVGIGAGAGAALLLGDPTPVTEPLPAAQSNPPTVEVEVEPEVVPEVDTETVETETVETEPTTTMGRRWTMGMRTGMATVSAAMVEPEVTMAEVAPETAMSEPAMTETVEPMVEAPRVVVRMTTPRMVTPMAETMEVAMDPEPTMTGSMVLRDWPD